MAKSRKKKLQPVKKPPPVVTAAESAPPETPEAKEWTPRYADAPPRRRQWSAFSGSLERMDLIALLPAVLVGFLIFANTLHGQFVYDDQRQIVRNTLIQDDAQFWHALATDVWAFKGGAAAVSNYWRPSFVMWMIANYRFFGLSPTGWHVMNILLHVLVIMLAFMLLRRLEVSRWVAGAIVLIFAVHPAHTESVAWLAGAPDIILSLALLGSMWYVAALCEGARTRWNWGLAIALYLIALGAKEVAILYPLIVVAMLWRPNTDEDSTGTTLPEALKVAAPFAAGAVLYLMIRQAILGQFAQFPEGSAGLEGTILSAPAVFAFYLRQLVFPYWIGPSYPLRAVTLHTIGLGNFVIPLIVSIIAVAGMLWLAARSRIARIGFALFLVPLLPAMHVAAFFPEQIVHDRYLYLPLLGFLMIVVPTLAQLLRPARVEETQPSQRKSWLIYAAAALVCVPLGVRAFEYNRAWTTELGLWERGIKSDPNSAYNYLQYGAVLAELKRNDEALAAYNCSLAINSLPNAYLGRGRVLTEMGRYEEAERDLREVLKMGSERVPAYTLYQVYEALVINYDRQGKVNEAANLLVEARGRLPQYAAALTEKLAFILYRSDKKQEAYAQLAAMRTQARTETLPESKLVLYRLGQLAAELGQYGDARAAFQEFLALTAGAQDAETKQARADAAATLNRLPG